MKFITNKTRLLRLSCCESCRGYLAPEYATLGQVSEKIDVFSFGVLVLEVVSGRRNIDLSYPANKAYLAEWVSFNIYFFLKFHKEAIGIVRVLHSNSLKMATWLVRSEHAMTPF